MRICDPWLPAGEGNVVGEVEGSMRGMRMELFGSSGGGMPRSFSIPVNADEIEWLESVCCCRPCRSVSIRCIRLLRESCEVKSLILDSQTALCTSLLLARRPSVS